MAKIKIELDSAIVEEAINAKVAPAVEEILAAHYDIKALITTELTKKRAAADGRYSMLMSLYSMGSPAGPPEEIIETYVRAAIHDAARKYIEEHVEDRRAMLESAFKKMMRDSSDQIVNAFVGMIEGADLSLNLSSTLAIEPPDRGGYDC